MERVNVLYFYFFDSIGSVHNPSLNNSLVIEAWQAVFQVTFLRVRACFKVENRRMIKMKEEKLFNYWAWWDKST